MHEHMKLSTRSTYGLHNSLEPISDPCPYAGPLGVLEDTINLQQTASRLTGGSVTERLETMRANTWVLSTNSQTGLALNVPPVLCHLPRRRP